MRDRQDDQSRYYYSQQPTYPQQQPQQPYPPQTYYPVPPPPKPDTTVQTIVLVLVIVFVVLPVILSVVLYFFVIGLAPSDDFSQVPSGQWGPVNLQSSTSAEISFAGMSQSVRPVQLNIYLVRNGTDEGRYTFPSNDDGQLSYADGINVGTLTYDDLAENGRINTGDKIVMTKLSPSSDYTIIMLWGPTGDLIAQSNFSTPS